MVELTAKVAADWFVALWLGTCTLMFTWRFLKEVYKDLKRDTYTSEPEHQAAMSCSLLALVLWLEKMEGLK